MTKFSIIEAKPHHCGQMVRVLRTHHAAVLAGLGLNAHRELRASFDQSTYRLAWLIDGKLAGLGGVTESALSATGMIWLALSQDAMHYPVQIVKEARRQLSNIMVVKRELVTAILLDDKSSMRFAEFMGFRAMPHSDGVAVQMVLRKSRKVFYSQETAELVSLH